MKVYDLLAGKYGFGHSRLLTKEEVLGHIPALDEEGLRGGVLYYDGQFDDSRLLIDLAQTAESEGAALVNYARVVKFARGGDGILNGLEWEDLETGYHHAIGGGWSSMQPAPLGTRSGGWTIRPAPRWSRRARACTWCSIAHF